MNRQYKFSVFDQKDNDNKKPVFKKKQIQFDLRFYKIHFSKLVLESILEHFDEPEYC